MNNNENSSLIQKEALSEIVRSLTENFSFDSLKELFRSIQNRTFKPLEEDIYYLYENLMKYNSEKSIFETLYLFGEMELEEGDICIVVSKVKNELKERSGKKRQYELAKTYLKTENKYIGGFFIFYDDNSNFRLSLVYEIQYGKGKRGFSDFKRYTYYVSKEQTNKTFISQFSEADFSSINNIIEAFSVEKVTKEFYREIANWYFWALKNAKFPDDCEFEKNGRNIGLLRLITRLIFIWFMKEKSLIPDILFDEKSLKELLNNFDRKNYNYYNAILQNLFFATLNTPINERKYEPAKNFIDSKKIKQTFKYHSEFKDKSKIKEIFSQIPFLNGGLFECLDMETGHPLNENGRYTYIDGFTEYPNNQAKIPNYLFFAENDIADLYEYYQDKSYSKINVKGIIKILKSYNFTIEENNPIDQEVALDPELLGKVFENLLASYNPETSTTARKATGSFYTPREIVEYMVETSLLEYFKSKLQDKITNLDEKLSDLFDINKTENPFDEKQTDEIIDLIEKIKILDPAVGSGAFLMSALHKLTFILSKLDPHNKKWKEKNIEAIKKNIFDPSLREEFINKVNENFNNNELDYGRKLYIIQHCLFGVDIQQIAIQISKLRFFISLLVDEKIDKNSQNFGLEPLPNLETKLVCANTLISLNNEDEDNNLFDSEIYAKLENDLFEIRDQYFLTSDIKKKDELKKKDGDIRRKIESTYLNEQGKNFQEQIKGKLLQIAKWDPYHINTSSDWFDPFWMFGVKDGFDIVIGNPPYIQLQNAFNSKDKYADFYKDQKYETFERTGDIYCLFYERGMKFLKQNGHLCYITSNKWMRAGYGESLRKFFLKYNPKILIDLGPGVFENATVDTNILSIQKSENKKNLLALTYKDKKQDLIKCLKEKVVILNKLTNDTWFIGSDAEQRLKEKIERIGKPLKDWDVKIYRGVLTGLNEAFIITTEKRNEILANCKDEDERRRTEAIIKPILRGRDIKRYYYEWAGLWVIVIPAGWTNQNRGNKNAKEFIDETFPSLINYLKPFEAKAKKRDDQGDYWWELRACAYYPEFEKEKVVYIEIMTDNWDEGYPFPSYSFWKDPGVVLNTAYIMTGKNLKYILGILNSKLGNRLVKKHVTQLQRRQFRMLAQYVQNFEIPPITSANQPIVSQIEALVDKIVEAKKQNKNADTSNWEREIDELVYKLYDLTEEEIKIIEKGKLL